MNETSDTRSIILGAAFKIFGRHGFGNTTIKLISQEAGMAAGSIYNHFKDKEDLFHTVVKEGWDHLLDEFKQIISSPLSVEEKYTTVIDYAFEQLKNAQPLLKGMLFDANERQLVQDRIEKIVDLLEELFSNSTLRKLLEVYIDRKQRHFFLKLTVMGVIQSISLSSHENVDTEIQVMKKEIFRLISRQT